MEKVLEIKELTKIYKNNRGVRNISFDIYKGDIFGFLGPNGAGKTTVMKIVAGLLHADSGSVRIFGFDLADQFEAAMAKVGGIIETADAYEYMTAVQNLKLTARFYPTLKRGRVEEVLELVGLTPYQKEKVGNFSLGMKQRLGLAAAILSKPELVILDEPTNGMDVEGMVHIRKTILHLSKEEQVTFFISSHLIHEIDLTCNRIGIINEGAMVREGLVTELTSPGEESLEDYFVRQVQKAREGGGDE